MAGVVGLGGSALGLSPVLAGVMSGFSVGATQQVVTNLMPPEPGKSDAPWYAGVAESAFIGAAAGGVAGGIVGAANPQSLPTKVLVGGVAGGGVGGGMKIATNVAAGRPWNEDLGQAIAIGATTGMVDAFTDYYGDKLVERAMVPRSARGAVDDVDGWRRLGDVDADGWRRPDVGDEDVGWLRPVQEQRGEPNTRLTLGGDDDLSQAIRRLDPEDQRLLKERTIEELRADGTELSLKTADRLEREAIFPIYLKDEQFNQVYLRRNPGANDVDSVLAFTTGNENVYLRTEGRTFEQLVLATLHEGTHIDTNWSGRLPGMRVFDNEFRSYNAELEFARSKGWLQHLPENRQTVQGVIQHIKDNYPWQKVYSDSALPSRLQRQSASRRDSEFVYRQASDFLRERGFSEDVIDRVMAMPGGAFEGLGDMPPLSARAFQAAVETVNSGDVYVVGGYAKGEHKPGPGGAKDFDVFIMDTGAWGLQPGGRLPVYQELLPGPPVPGGWVDSRAGFFGESLPGPWIRFRPGEPPKMGWGVLVRPKR